MKYAAAVFVLVVIGGAYYFQATLDERLRNTNYVPPKQQTVGEWAARLCAVEAPSDPDCVARHVFAKSAERWFAEDKRRLDRVR